MNMAEPLSQPATLLRGELRFNEAMGRHVSWRAGGTAARAYIPRDHDDLAAFLGSLPAHEPVCFVGLGSNLLVRDGGFRGTVVLMHHTHGALHMDGGELYADAGMASPKVARFAAMHALEGAEFLAGIPGTVGGALAMNAGCYGAQTWDIAVRARVVDRQGRIRVRGREDYEIGYRHCALGAARRVEAGMQEEWFLGAWFALAAGDVERARARIKEWLTRRVATQPLNLPNAGSVFRNPAGDYAARLIEACGLKRYAIGGARISEVHANFIVNPDRRASAADIEALIAHAQHTVRTRFGVELEPEVRIVGERP
jgi:UDP-N-acetylmuramate dehydrogenase